MKRIKKTKKWASRVVIKFVIWGFVVATLLGAGFIVSAFAYYSKDLPDLEKIDAPMVQSTKIYDRTGEILLYDVYGEEKRTAVSFEKIPQSIKDATIAIEDERFYKHNGLDIKSLLRALFVNLTRQRVVQGGSTITQQLIKNYFLSPERTIARKIKEFVLSLQLERKYSKDEILNFYLNQIPYGANAYGIESAALTFFNKRALDLSLAQSATLAALPKAPSYYWKNKEELKKRRDYILNRMYNIGFVAKEELDAALAENMEFSKQSQNIKAPHFVIYVKNYLEEKYGEDYVFKNGLKVTTTIDWDIQQIAERLIYEAAIKNKKLYDARNAALVAVDVKTGQILAMVGSYDYFDEKNDGNVNVATSDPGRQPGSSFKPFSYAAAFERGFTPNTVLFDLPTEFSTYYDQCPLIEIKYQTEEEKEINISTENNKCYHPQNYDGKFRGPVTLKSALAQSLNIPSVKVLYLAGIKETVDLAQRLGISTLKNNNYYGLSLGLGSVEVKPLDMALAYSVFANDGVKNEKSAVLRVENYQGKILEEHKTKTKQAINSQIARQITDILSDNLARTPMFGENSSLYTVGIPSAAKTGTTQDYKDAWTIGYTPDIAVAIWVGNNNGDKILKSRASAMVTGPIWNSFIKEVVQKKGVKNSFIPPENPLPQNNEILNGSFEIVKKIKIDKTSKKLATEYTPIDFIEEIIQKEVHSILYYINPKKPKESGDENRDPQFINWEMPILEWVKEQNLFGKNYNITPNKVTQEYDDIHTPQNQPNIDILNISDNTIVNPPNLIIKTNITSVFPVKQVDYFFNSQSLGSVFYPPYNLMFPVSKINDLGENNSGVLKIVAYDIYGNRKEKQISIQILLAL